MAGHRFYLVETEAKAHLRAGGKLDAGRRMNRMSRMAFVRLYGLSFSENV